MIYILISILLNSGDFIEVAQEAPTSQKFSLDVFIFYCIIFS